MADFDNDNIFRRLFSELTFEDDSAPPSLKAKLYSGLIREQLSTGKLASLDATVTAGHGICVFEKLVQIAPVGEVAKSPFYCNWCHARVLGEHSDNPPIFWANCPYVAFKRS